MYWLPVLLILPYLFTILWIYKGLLRLKPFKISVNPSTFVSVVIACRNEQQNLPPLLNSISQQNYPDHLFEVIIVDDNSTDKTKEIASTFSGIRNLFSLSNTGTGKKQALRTGINAASGRLIITTDADCRMGVDWIRTIAAFYEMKKPDMIICPVRLESRHGFFRAFQELEFMSLQGVTAGSALNNEATMCNGANLAFTKEAYLKNSDNLNNEINSGDDVFLLHSLKKENSSKILWLESGDALVKTKFSPTFHSFMQQRSRWISKSTVYKDRFTIQLGITTLFAVIMQFTYLIGGLINPDLIAVFLSVFILKSVPDFLIILNTSSRYDRGELMWWFLPSQLLYPFYVLSVLIFPILNPKSSIRNPQSAIRNNKISSPFPKGT